MKLCAAYTIWLSNLLACRVIVSYEEVCPIIDLHGFYCETRAKGRPIVDTISNWYLLIYNGEAGYALNHVCHFIQL